MQKIVAIGGLTLLLGLATQAHAGEYVPQGNGWTLTATAPTSTATAGVGQNPSDSQNASDTQKTSLRWEWMENNPQDNPTPVQIRLNFSATVGDCYAAGGIFSYAFTDVYLGFANSGFSNAHFGNFNESQGGDPSTSPGFTTTTSVVKPYNGAQIIFDDAEITAKTSAGATGEDDMATAYTTTGNLISASLEAR